MIIQDRDLHRKIMELSVPNCMDFYLLQKWYVSDNTEDVGPVENFQYSKILDWLELQISAIQKLAELVRYTFCDFNLRPFISYTAWDGSNIVLD